MVPTLSLVFMVISLLVSVGLPIVLFFVYRKKYGAKFIPALVGALAFIIFALILESLVHRMILQPDATGSIPLMSKPVLYMLYGGLMAGIFEETARYLSFHLLKKKYGGIGNALSYGVGHGGIEAILLVGSTMLSNLVLSFYVNSGTLDSIVAMTATTSPESAAALEQGAELLATTPSYMFLLGGIERVGAIVIHIALSVLVYYAVVRRDKWWLFPVAIVLHALVDFPAVLMQIGIINNVFVLEAFVLIIAAAFALLAFAVHKRLKPPAQSVVPAEAPVV